MTATIVNLGRARKAKARTDREAQAVTNRAAFGRTGAGKKTDRVDAERRERALDGAKLGD